MGMSKLTIAVALTMTFGVLVIPGLRAQHTGQHQDQHQQQMMQQHMAQMQQTMQRMDRISEQAHHLAEEMAQHSHGRMTEGHQAMQRMDESMASMAEEMKGLMEHMQEIAHDSALMRDPSMMADMDFLNMHFEAAAEWMEKGLEVMERMHKRAVQQRPGR